MRKIFERLRAEGADYFEKIAGSEKTPIVRDRELLFLYHERERLVNQVKLNHNISSLDNPVYFEKFGSGGPFALHMVLPSKARMEYSLEVDYETGETEYRNDPGNPVQSFCPFGSKSVACTESYKTPAWAIRRNGVPRGKLEEHVLESEALGGPREIRIHIPAVPAPAKGYPVLIIHDGTDFINYGDMLTVLDNLVYQGEMEPFLAVLTKPENRNLEYTCMPEHTFHLAEELLPWVRDRYPATSKREKTGLMGSSLGAISSLHTAYTYPSLFKPLLIQSGSLRFHETKGTAPAFEPVDEFDRIMLFLEGKFFPRGFPRKMRIFQSCGTFEPLLSFNRRFYEELKKLHQDVVYSENHDGHNWISWRDQLGAGFSFLFPPDGRSAARPVIKRILGSLGSRQSTEDEGMKLQAGRDHRRKTGRTKNVEESL